MDETFDQLLDALAGKAGPEVLRQLEDPESDISAVFSYLRRRVATALSIRPEVLTKDRNLLPLLKVADQCAPPELRLFAPEGTIRISQVLVRPFRQRRGSVLAIASATLNDQIEIRGIRIVHRRGSIGVRMPWFRKRVTCPACRERNRPGARVCARCETVLPRRSRVDTTVRDPREGTVRIRDKDLVKRLQKRVLARYQEILEGSSPDGSEEQATGEVRARNTGPAALWFTSGAAGAPGDEPSGTTGSPDSGEGDPPAPSVVPRKTLEPGDAVAGAEGKAGFPVDHPLLAKYWRPSERLAIVLHWFFLCAQEGRDVPIAEAVASWEGEAGKEWRSERFWRDMKDQEAEIERHKYHMSMRANRDVGREDAEEDWLKNHGEAWRQWREEDIESL